ncbi:MAG TPA: aminotransferase class V-fold PLP-dependent enzyme [Candidatus Bathyarchaeia archaeon]|nr:aminotransferase class V-fold PLP-dependent enzyme [Candidatus Bathyarchaeia archaeon]
MKGRKLSVASAYLDNAATTSIDSEVLRAMLPYFKEKFGNPSSVHSWGQAARQSVDESRQTIANFLGAGASEIIFTGCSTESISLAHKGLVEAVSSQQNFKSKIPHIITCRIEHKAVLETCRHLEKRNLAEVTYLPVDRFGLVAIADLEKAVKANTVLVSIMYVNNEVGTVEPIGEIGKLIKKLNDLRMAHDEPKIYFHTDATQAIQYLDCRVDKLRVDFLSLTGHKIHAPKGIGALYIREKTPLVCQQDGGGQEGGLRGGTENVAFIVGLAKAIDLVTRNKDKNIKRIKDLQQKLIRGVLKIPGVNLTGHPEKRTPHIASFTIKGVEGEAVLLLLDSEGIAASSGSACTSGSLKPSHVLLAMGIPPEVAHGSLRLSLCKETTDREVNYALSILPKVIARLRKMAPRF